MLRAEHLSVHAADPSGVGLKKLLDDVTLDFSSGMVTVVLGENGAGKSTLLDCLSGVRDPDRGRVFLQQRACDQIEVRERAQLIASIGQRDCGAANMGVATRVGQGLAARRGADALHDSSVVSAVSKIMEALGLRGLESRALGSLSGGERRRVEVARALVDDEASVVILDEPHAGLDVRHQPKVSQALQERARAGCTVITSVHHLDVALHLADAFVGLRGGRVVATGNATEPLDAKALSTIFGIEAEVVTQGGRVGIMHRASSSRTRALGDQETGDQETGDQETGDQ